jgi:hypothetical protein
MKKLLFSIAALTLTTGLFAQKKADEIAKFKSETIEMGKIKQDIPATAIFEVTNIGSEPLIIDEANPTCGCTIGDYTKEPIAPGKTGFIKATYNAKNLNAFEKHLTVKFAGVTDVKSITIKGEVLNAEDYAKIAPAAETKDDKIITSDNKVKAAPSTPAKKTTTTKTTTTVKKPA